MNILILFCCVVIFGGVILKIISTYSNNKIFCTFFNWHHKIYDKKWNGFCLHGKCSRCHKNLIELNNNWYLNED
jgi:hypothetical protein